ncbi:hypothetical protein, conserved [Trypanosoma brucei gambiense DAL972]|uniref:Uncharacterized protein n=1 Tax=Trypanosoma brucei gambiense (strain MHOM/CI/86/DAL972) TaxID=679716 RepID=D0A2S9_TRYB9|nr:hypothetical protein, conserved [Trypanosoma brucei gambiense DAL972]CBH15573.1 hypothetical protein, conserved [Trypanosoma brucei gambiense DAL972]|eukprot:XP_011777837.1 hypothetical protein, conserved [Trypanosoma brucei gambiense DAL972]
MMQNGFVLILFHLLLSVVPPGRGVEWEGSSDDQKHGSHHQFFNVSENERLLSKLRLPFRLSLTSVKETTDLAREVVFLQRVGGMCPRLDMWERVEVLFGIGTPLEEKYGVERLELVQALLEPAVIRFHEDDLETVSDPLGFIGLMVQGQGTVIWVHFSELVVSHMVGQPPSLNVNVVAVFQRVERWAKKTRLNRHRLQMEAEYARVRSEHLIAIDHDRHKMKEEATERRRRKEFLRDLREFNKQNSQGTVHHNKGLENAGLSDDGAAVREQIGTRCENIRHAIRTVKSQGVPTTETRMQYLLKKERRVCVTPLEEEDSNLTDADVCDIRCLAYCDGVSALHNWSERSGSSNSVSQLHALYHTVLFNRTNSSMSVSNDYLSYLRQLVMEDVERGIFSTCSDICSPSPSLRKEMNFFAGVLALLDSGGMRNKTAQKVKSARVDSEWWFRARSGYLRIWAAARSGSERALKALATMRENGMLTPQQSRMALIFLHVSLAQDKSSIWNIAAETLTAPRGSSFSIPMGKLLRTERFFGVENSWSAVNEPYMTRSYVGAVGVEADGGNDDEREGALYYAPSQSVQRDIFIAKLYIAGIKGVQRDMQRAECLLLTILRKLEYTCDVEHAASEDEVYFSGGGRGGGCEEHMDQLRVLRYKLPALGRCRFSTTGNNTASALRTEALLRFGGMSWSEESFPLLHDTLLLLSYIHLVDGLKFNLSAKYAFQAIQLGAAAFHTALRSIPEAVVAEFYAYRNNSERLKVLMRGRKPPASSLLMHAMRRGEPRDDLEDFTRSGFLTSEALLLLAVAAPQLGAEGEQLMRVVAESFYGSASCVEHPSRSSCVIQLSFFLLREAARLWKDEEREPSVFDSSYGSPHRADPFLLMALLLQKGKITVEDIRQGSVFNKALYAPSTSHVLRPTAADTRDSYVSKILKLARQTSPYILKPIARENSKNRRGFMDNSTTLREFQATRLAIQRSLHEHDILPLLVVSDLHDYLYENGWTRIQRFLGNLWDTICAPFTKLKEEYLEEQFAEEVISEKQGGNALTTIAEKLAESISASNSVREGSIALQLLSAALLSGEPDGFSILLTEEMDRKNQHLSSFAVFLSEHLWCRGTITGVWVEEHKAAQWHDKKPKTRGYGALFDVNTQAPFDYTLSESRLEMFALLALKRALSRQASTSHGDVISSSVNRSLSQEEVDKSVGELALCGGVLIGTFLEKQRPFPPHKPYEGMHLPVGNSRCLRQLLKHIEITGVSPFQGISAAEVEIWLLNTLVSFTELQSKYYTISLLGRYRGLSSKKEEWEGRRLRKRLVEPWRRVNGEEWTEMWVPDVGEGAVYNRRLHDISGTYLGARVKWFFRNVIFYGSHLLRWFW